MKSFFLSLIFFIKSFFVKQQYDVIFYFPRHFKRGKKNQNLYFSHLINTCKDHQISYLVFEEPSIGIKYYYDKEIVPFDFLFFLVILFRKVFLFNNNFRLVDNRIGRFIAYIFFRNISFNNFITISQSMVSLFRGINFKSKIFDLQHGIIHPEKNNYLLLGMPDINLIKNDVHVLFSGIAYQNLMLHNDSTLFFKEKSFHIGSNLYPKDPLHVKFNNKILVTLQFTDDHTNDENQLLLESLEQYIISNHQSVMFYIKSHPRSYCDREFKELLKLSNVTVAPPYLDDCFHLCSLHLTAYSTTVFEASLFGIPTILLNPIKKFSYFIKYFNYPLCNVLDDFYKKDIYNNSSLSVQRWASLYYSKFNSDKFLNVLKR